MYRAKYQKLNVLSIHFYTITLQKLLLARNVQALRKKQVLYFIPYK